LGFVHSFALHMHRFMYIHSNSFVTCDRGTVSGSSVSMSERAVKKFEAKITTVAAHNVFQGQLIAEGPAL
jgi:hypothetical protein